jgi:hypothetical protein
MYRSGLVLQKDLPQFIDLVVIQGNFTVAAVRQVMDSIYIARGNEISRISLHLYYIQELLDLL